jgi:hypothetical protein
LSWHIIYLPLRYCRICEFQYAVRMHRAVLNKTIPRSRIARINFFPQTLARTETNLHNNIAFHRYHRSGSERRARVQNMIATLIRITKADFRTVSSPTRGALSHFRRSHRTRRSIEFIKEAKSFVTTHQNDTFNFHKN